MINAEETANFELFRDCLSTPLIDKFATKPPKSKGKRKSGHGRKKSQLPTSEIGVENEDGKDAEELSDFINVSMSNVHPHSKHTDESQIVHRPRSIHLLPHRPPHPHLLNLHQYPLSLRPLHPTPSLLLCSLHPASTRPLSNRHPHDLRPSPLLLLLPRHTPASRRFRPPRPRPLRLPLPHHHAPAPARPDQGPRGGVRDLSPRARPAHLPPPDPARRAREGGEEGLARKGGAE
jgi:hypothetical protein